MTRYELDTAKLLRVLDDKRQRLGMSWRQFADETGVDHQAFRRMREGRKVTADTALTLLVFLGADYLPVTRPTGHSRLNQI